MVCLYCFSTSWLPHLGQRMAYTCPFIGMVWIVWPFLSLSSRKKCSSSMKWTINSSASTSATSLYQPRTVILVTVSPSCFCKSRSVGRRTSRSFPLCRMVLHRCHISLVHKVLSPCSFILNPTPYSTVSYKPFPVYYEVEKHHCLVSSKLLSLFDSVTIYSI